MCSDCEVYSLEQHGLTRSECTYNDVSCVGVTDICETRAGGWGGEECMGVRLWSQLLDPSGIILHPIVMVISLLS